MKPRQRLSRPSTASTSRSISISHGGLSASPVPTSSMARPPSATLTRPGSAAQSLRSPSPQQQSAARRKKSELFLLHRKASSSSMLAVPSEAVPKRSLLSEKPKTSVSKIHSADEFINALMTDNASTVTECGEFACDVPPTSSALNTSNNAAATAGNGSNLVMALRSVVKHTRRAASSTGLSHHISKDDEENEAGEDRVELQFEPIDDDAAVEAAFIASHPKQQPPSIIHSLSARRHHGKREGPTLQSVLSAEDSKQCGIKRPQSATPLTRGLNSEAGSAWQKVLNVEYNAFFEKKKKERDEQMSPTGGSFITQMAFSHINAVSSPILKAAMEIPSPLRTRKSQQQSGARFLTRGASSATLMAVRSDNQKIQTACQSQETWNRLWAHKRSQATHIPLNERKYESVKSKIEFLRGDLQARREFNRVIVENEVARRKKEYEEKGNMKARNVEVMAQFADYFTKAKRATSSIVNRNRLDNAKLKRQGLQSWKMARAIDGLQKPEFMREQRQWETEVELLQNMWATSIFLAISIGELHDRMLDRYRADGRADRLRYFQRYDAPLQKNIQHRRAIRMLRAAKCIWRVWMRLRIRIRIRKKTNAINIIRNFVKDLGKSTQIANAVRKKMKCVKRLQRRFNFVKVFRALREQLCVMQLDVSLRKLFYDDEQEILKLKSAHKQYERELSQKRGLHRLARNDLLSKHRKQTDEQVMWLIQRQQTMVSMPADLKKQLVHEYCVKKTIDYANQCFRYGVACRQYKEELLNAEEERQLLLSSGVQSPGGGSIGIEPQKPFRPYLRCLFTNEEMTKIATTAMERIQKATAKGKEEQEEAHQKSPSSSR